MPKKTIQSSLRVGLISLGCAKNLVDAEIMLGTLMQSGVEITNDAAAADAVIVNTCSFIDAAQEESVDTILESTAVRDAQNRGQAVIVSGCLPQRFRDELPKLLPEVDAFMGIDQVAQAAEIVRGAVARRAERVNSGAKPGAMRSAGAKSKRQLLGRLAAADALRPDGDHGAVEVARGAKTKVVMAPQGAPGPIVEVTLRPKFIPDFGTPRFRLTPAHFAYVKIAEGCNHPCSFCTIPRMRGSHRSRGQQDIVREVRELVRQGVREINLISQDSTYYGIDLRPSRSGSVAAPDRFRAAVEALPEQVPTLSTLLRALNDVPGDFWIRLLYTHPAHWTDELIRTIGDCPKVARYVDMPLQHIHDVMLERMRRETSRAYIEELMAKIRAGIPGIALRTTFIVGFPGETEEYFQSLLGFIRATRFERLGVFTCSQEEDTRAAGMQGQVPDRVKRLRREAAMAAQLDVARGVGDQYRGRTLKVLVEKQATRTDLATAQIRSWEHGLIRSAEGQSPLPRGKYWIARGEADAPDIDGRVYVRGEVRPGEFARVRVVEHTAYDLIAEVL